MPQDPQRSLGSAISLIMPAFRKHRPPDWPTWFAPRGYPHFDEHVRSPDQVCELVESPELIAARAFLPFIHFKKNVRKFKREENKFVKKERPLSYASHTDSQIFRHYCLLLSERYEALLAASGAAEAVLAYRRFQPPRCNIHFANRAFRFVEESAPCVAIAFDVKDFFESLNHKLLKNQWRTVVGAGTLPDDHYAVFKAVTRYSWVERDALLTELGISKSKHATWPGPLCTPAQFRDQVRAKGLIQFKTDGKGIPQGSPISALLSNIYMLPVDLHLCKLTKERHALYLRYSDDILIICPVDVRASLEEELRKSMQSVSLVLHDGPGKFTAATFQRTAMHSLGCDRSLQYLGFSFDGQKAHIRSQTVARYLRKMRKAVRREKWLAERSQKAGGNPRVRRKRLYGKFSHLGRRNFISYATMAQKEIDNNAIRDQIKHHWRDLHAELIVE